MTHRDLRTAAWTEDALTVANVLVHTACCAIYVSVR